MRTYLVSLDPLSWPLFEREIEGNAEVLERLDEERLLLRCEEHFRSLFVRHRFPVQVEQHPPDLELESVRPFVWDGLSVDRLQQGPYAIQLEANQRMPWSFSALVEVLRQDLGLPAEGFEPRRPEVVLSAYLHQREGRCRLFAGISTARENLSPWASGRCRIPRDEESVSRAEGKLLEAAEAFRLSLQGHKKTALDLGAAPGGWTRVLASKGFRVEAVDPAELDPAVSALPGVDHHRETAGSFLAKHKGLFDLLVSDMKMEAGMAASLLNDCAHRLQPGRGRLLTTLKLAKGPSALTGARQALARLGQAYEILEARQLYFNRSEITVLARPLNPS